MVELVLGANQMQIHRHIGTSTICTGLAVVAIALIGISFPVDAGEKCPLGLCKGSRVIIYDQNHKRVGTIENRGYGTKRIQLRDNRNRITGYIDGSGRTYDSNHRRTGSVGTSKSIGKPWWR